MLDDFETAPIDEKLRATLVFLKKLTLTPDDLGPGDIEPLRRAGVSEPAIRDAIDVCVGLSVLDRVADALGFTLLDDPGYDFIARFLLRRGYRM